MADTTTSGAISDLARCLAPGARLNEPLARHSSLRVGGTADLFLVARSPEQIAQAVDEASKRRVAWRAIGSASNLLIADQGVRGLVMKVVGGTIRQLRPEGDEIPVRADAGCLLAAIGKRLAMDGLSGLEWAVNVPGTVGAAVVNNSGAFGSCVAEHLLEAEVYVSGRGVVSLTPPQLNLGYRTSRLKRQDLVGVVLAATFRLTTGDTEALRARIGEIQQTRRATQPAGHSVGSVFANPLAAFAGQLIEEAGLKGTRVGDAEISRLHANFILNRGGASSSDVLELIKLVQARVWERCGQRLTPELQLLGDFPPDAFAGPPGSGNETR